jgi:hypothetical protein
MVANTPEGYHGYWAQNIYQVNPNFGTEQDLLQLVQECHSRDIWVMVRFSRFALCPEIIYICDDAARRCVSSHWRDLVLSSRNADI